MLHVLFKTNRMAKIHAFNTYTTQILKIPFGDPLSSAPAVFMTDSVTHSYIDRVAVQYACKRCPVVNNTHKTDQMFNVIKVHVITVLLLHITCRCLLLP